jgi:hypothetical protein
MTSSIPSHVIDYATTYQAMTAQIIELIDKDPTAKGNDNPTVKETFALIEALADSVGDIITDVDDMKTKLKEWGDKMQQSHDDLYKGAANIQAAETDLQSDINKMNTAIEGLQAYIYAENKAIGYGGIAIGIGLFAVVAGIALAPVTDGYSLIVAGAGALAIIGGAVNWGVMQNKINKQFDEIAKDQQRITDDKRQLVALLGLSLSSNTAISAIEIATQTLSDVRTMWAVFQGELQGTLDKLNKADEELYAIVNKAYIQGAQTEWNLAVEFAQQLVGKKLEVEVKELPMAA